MNTLCTRQDLSVHSQQLSASSNLNHHTTMSAHTFPLNEGRLTTRQQVNILFTPSIAYHTWRQTNKMDGEETDGSFRHSSHSHPHQEQYVIMIRRCNPWRRGHACMGAWQTCHERGETHNRVKTTTIFLCRPANISTTLSSRKTITYVSPKVFSPKNYLHQNHRVLLGHFLVWAKHWLLVKKAKIIIRKSFYRNRITVVFTSVSSKHSIIRKAPPLPNISCKKKWSHWKNANKDLLVTFRWKK